MRIILKKLFGLFNHFRNNYNEKAYPNIPKFVKIDADYTSDEYKQRVRELGFTKYETNLIIKGIKKIFNNDKATELEGFYAIDRNTKTWFYNPNGGPESVRRPKEMFNYLEKNIEAEMIVIHNHRGNTIPSPNDISALNSTGNKGYGIIACNNGDIYCYEITKKLKYEIIECFKKEDRQCETMLQRKELLLKFCKENGIIFVESKKGGN